MIHRQSHKIGPEHSRPRAGLRRVSLVGVAALLLTLFLPLQAFAQPTPVPVPTPPNPNPAKQLTDQECTKKYGDTHFVGVYGVNESVRYHPEMDAVFEELNERLPPEETLNPQTGKPHVIEYPAPTWNDFDLAQ